MGRAEERTTLLSTDELSSLPKSEAEYRKLSTCNIKTLSIWLAAVFLIYLTLIVAIPFHKTGDLHHHIPIEFARESYVDVDDTGLQVWYRTWGNRHHGIPVLFVHGGPGNAIADYGHGNARFFDAKKYFVVEVDQRGTGRSRPSVRDSAANMRFYQDISVDIMAADYEVIREHIGIAKWLVFGGSFGSTVSLRYGTLYPERCLGLILRGIYLDTPAEVEAVYSQNSYKHKPSRLDEFQILFGYAAKNDPQLDPNDGHGILQQYASMIEKGDRKAIWHWHVFENNLMEDDPRNLLDPNVIKSHIFPEAQSVAFFETRLWLHGSYESPIQLLDLVDELQKTPIWICQGLRDEVCPAKYARRLVDALVDTYAVFTARFVDGHHEQTDPVIANCLISSLADFRRQY